MFTHETFLSSSTLIPFIILLLIEILKKREKNRFKNKQECIQFYNYSGIETGFIRNTECNNVLQLDMIFKLYSFLEDIADSVLIY